MGVRTETGRPYILHADTAALQAAARYQVLLPPASARPTPSTPPTPPTPPIPHPRLVEHGLASTCQDYMRELADWLVARVEEGVTQVWCGRQRMSRHLPPTSLF